jgi:hydroxypyruvate reductase
MMETLHKGKAKQVLGDLFSHTLRELDLPTALDRSREDLGEIISEHRKSPNDTTRIRLIAFGKAGLRMTQWFTETFELDRVRGIVSAPVVDEQLWPNIECFAGGHPVPNEASIEAAYAALELTRDATADDLVVFLISGGGSALVDCPIREGIPLEDIQRFHETLVTCGADIKAMNIVRKHLSAIKGGRLAVSAAPARQVTLFVSDVPDGQEFIVASGPTTPDKSSLVDFRRVARIYDFHEKLPESYARLIDDRSLPATAKAEDPAFERSSWRCVLSNRDAVGAVKSFAEDAGWSVAIDNSVDDKPVPFAAERLLNGLARLQDAFPDKPACVICGGELRSPVTGNGIGGRNQAFVLECVPRIAGRNLAVMSVGTDGIDGNSEAAGAVADGKTLERAEELGLDPELYAENSDSNSFFENLGDDIVTGPTGNNVRDIRVLLSWP